MMRGGRKKRAVAGFRNTPSPQLQVPMLTKKGPPRLCLSPVKPVHLNQFRRPQATWRAVILKSDPDVLYESLVVVFIWLTFSTVRP